MIITTPHHTLDLGARVHVMGILNVTPDSFSDGGTLDHDRLLVTRVADMVAAGVDILDIGGESTRPGAAPVSLAAEIERVIPAIETIRRRFSTPISVDTSKAEVGRLALEAGADIINDISAMRFDPAMLPLVVATKVPVIIMHMQGIPGTMQERPHYTDVVAEIKAELRQWLDHAETQGLSRSKIIIDPGLGFGKTVDHNLSILKHIPSFTELGCPVLIGHSRKRFIGILVGEKDAARLDVGTAAISALCARSGAAILRVHDVGKTVQAVKLARSIEAAL
ncbi:MAG: dihydropteroate synthase [Desulfurivibrionaceae bacterium]|nr:dihydropteroate synthase [Desulfurivibrionaceae bacterium]